MTKEKKSTRKERNRSDTLNMRINPKLKYLAEIAARYEDRSLSNFIERAITQALASERVFEKELPPLSLWGDGLWDEDDATRMFMLATSYPDLLNGPQTKLWALLSGSMMKNEGKITLRKFLEYYNSPAIDKKHLVIDEGGE